MKKLARFVALILCLCLALTILISCNTEDENTGFYDPNKGVEVPPSVAEKVLLRVVDGEKRLVEFNYGYIGTYSAKEISDEPADKIYSRDVVYLYAYNAQLDDDDIRWSLKDVKNEGMQENGIYVFRITEGQDFYTSNYKGSIHNGTYSYPHFETHKLPKELFAGDSGTIYVEFFGVYVEEYYKSILTLGDVTWYKKKPYETRYILGPLTPYSSAIKYTVSGGVINMEIQ